MTVKEYTPLPGFYDLRDYELPRKEFRTLAEAQRLLYSWEVHRRRGHPVPPEIRNLSGEYQQRLSQYPLRLQRVRKKVPKREGSNE